MSLEISVSSPETNPPFDVWLDGRPDLAASSRRKYARVIRGFNRSHNDISVEGLGNFLNTHKQRHVKAALLLYCKYIAKPDIASEIRDMRIKYPRRIPRAIPDLDDIMSVINSCDHETKYLALFLLFTGCRAGEAFTVCLNDFDNDGKVTVRDIKVEGKTREIYLPDEMFADLMFYIIQTKGVLGNEPVFYTKSKGTIDTKWRDFHTKLNETARRKIGRGIQTHDFRRFCATFLYNKTHDIEFVSRILGHSDISTTHKYTQYARQTQDLKKSKQILNELQTRPSRRSEESA